MAALHRPLERLMSPSWPRYPMEKGLPFMLKEFAGERLLFLVTPDGQVLLEIFPLLLEPQRDHLLVVRFLPLGGQLPLVACRQLLQLLLPLFLQEEKKQTKTRIIITNI